jgi:DNA-binding response OmpR family regulator
MSGKKKILVVDDEQVALKILSIRLEINGFNVITAQDGAAALDRARKEKPDLIVLDLMLPNINGFEVCRMLKFDDAYKNIPIIILSALHDQKERDRAVACGADAYFIKPFDLDLLMSKMRSFLE